MLFRRLETVEICGLWQIISQKNLYLYYRIKYRKGKKMRKMLLLALVLLLASACKKPGQEVPKGFEGVWICKTLTTNPPIIMEEAGRHGRLVDEVFGFEYSTDVSIHNFKILPNNRMYLLRDLKSHENGQEVELTEEELIAKKRYFDYTILDNGKEAVWKEDQVAANFKFNLKRDELEVSTRISDWVVDGKRGSFYDEIIKDAKQNIKNGWRVWNGTTRRVPLSEAEKQMVQKVLDAVEKAGTIELKFTFTRQK